MKKDDRLGKVTQVYKLPGHTIVWRSWNSEQ